MNLEEINAWMKKVPTHKGKPLTNKRYYGEQLFWITIFIGLWLLFCLVVPSMQSLTLCEQSAPNGFHMVSYNQYDRICTFANDTAIIKENYVFDSTKNKYLLYEVKT